MIELHALTPGGISNASLLKINYSTSGGKGPKRVMITSGSTPSSTNGAPRMAMGTTFRGVIRVDSMLLTSATPNADVTASGTYFQMKSGSAASSD